MPRNRSSKFGNDAKNTALGTFQLKGKKWEVVGDSITEVNYRSSKNYHAYIQEWAGCTVINHGISGTGWFTPSSSGGTNAIHQRLNALDSTADIITVFAGTNDWAEVGKTLALGTLGDTDPTVSFYGAVNSVLTQLIAKYPTKTIAVFTPLPRSGSQIETLNASGISLKQVTDAIIQVCTRYGIPVLDLYRNSGFFPWNTTNNSAFFSSPTSPNGDGLHPNAEGHKKLAYKILEFLNSIIGSYSLTSDVSAPTPTVIVSDDFNRADNASSLGVASTGQTWQALSGTWGIISNQAYMPAGTDCAAVVESGVSDCIVQVKYSTNAAYTSLAVRAVDVNNFMYIQYNGTRIGIYTKIAGVFTKLTDVARSIANGDILKVSMSGSNYVITVNETQILTATTTQFQTATKHGLVANGTTSRFDDFVVSVA